MNLSFARDHLQRLGWKPHQVQGILGNLAAESGVKLNTNAVGDNGTSFGIAQWRGPRYDALRAFAGRQNADPSDLRTQLDFLNHELNTTEKRAGDMLRGSTDVLGATRAMVSFERPRGFSWDNPDNSMHFSKRLNYANNIDGLLAGNFTPVPDKPAPSMTPVPDKGIELAKENIDKAAPVVAAAASPIGDIEGGLKGLAKAFGGGGGSGEGGEAVPIRPVPLSNFGQEQQSRMAQAQSMMADIMNRRRSVKGLLG